MTYIKILLLSIVLHMGHAQIYLACNKEDFNLQEGCTCLNPHQPIIFCQSLGLTNVPNVSKAHTLHLENNSISSLPAYAFSHISGLKKVLLSNNVIEEVDLKAFDNLTLEWLDMSNNKLTTIPTMFKDDDQQSLASLTVLKLSKNYIYDIGSEAFKGVPNLQQLYVDGNPVNRISPGAWLEPRNLRLLELSADGMDIMKIPTYNLRQLTSLVVRGGKPKRLDIMKTWFDSFPQLRHLTLSGLGLRHTHLVKGRFPRLLLSLRLQGNEFTEVPFHVLNNLPVLQELDLSRNMIQRLSYPSKTKHLPSHILRFNISNNVLTFANARHLMSLGNALQIDISNNYLDDIYWSVSEIEEFLRPEVVLYLGGNPWKCTCRNKWMKDLVDRQLSHHNGHMTDYEINNTYRCGHGGSNNGQLIRDVPSSVFECRRN